jgi:hypothetical protein
VSHTATAANRNGAPKRRHKVNVTNKFSATIEAREYELTKIPRKLNQLTYFCAFRRRRRHLTGFEQSTLMTEN